MKRAREPPLGGPQQRHHGSSGSEDTERAEKKLQPSRARKRQIDQNEETDNLEEPTDKSRRVKRRDKVFDRGK